MTGAIVQFVLAALFVVIIVTTVRSIDKPRKPVSAREAFVSVVVHGVFAVVFVILGVAELGGHV